MLTIAKKIKIDYSHALYNYVGKCNNIHGHTSTIICYFNGEQDNNTGMIIDFGILKNILNKVIVDRFDHSLILNSSESNYFIEFMKIRSKKIVTLPFEPTAENFVKYIATELQKEIEKYNIRLVKIELYETENNFVVYEI